MARSELTLVLGLGESGLAMARWLARQGVALRVADSRDTPPGVERLRAEAPAAEIVTGPFAETLLDGVGRLAISPGLDPRQAPADGPLDGLVVAELEMQKGDVFDTAPVAAIEAVVADQVQGPGDPAPMTPRHHQQHPIRHPLA